MKNTVSLLIFIISSASCLSKSYLPLVSIFAPVSAIRTVWSSALNTSQATNLVAASQIIPGTLGSPAI